MDRPIQLRSFERITLGEELLDKLLEQGMSPEDVKLINNDLSGTLAKDWVGAWQAIRMVSGEEPLAHRQTRSLFGSNFTGVYEAQHHVGSYPLPALQQLLTIPWTEADLAPKRDSWLLFPGVSASINQMEEWEKPIEVDVSNEPHPPLSTTMRLLRLCASPFWEFSTPPRKRLIRRPSRELLCHRHDWCGPQGIFTQCVSPYWYLMPKKLQYINQSGTMQMERLRTDGQRPSFTCEACYYLILHFMRTGERLCSNSIIRTGDRSGRNFMQVGPFTEKGIMFSRGYKASYDIGVLPVITK